ncbi:MAG TPA: hypothetical protein VHQ39_09765, partial [Dongiaceae bacterium]|nr:hypothetical protein [Dongiaceae bacterium]
RRSSGDKAMRCWTIGLPGISVPSAENKPFQIISFALTSPQRDKIVPVARAGRLAHHGVDVRSGNSH